MVDITTPELAIGKAFGRLITKDIYELLKGYTSLQRKIKKLKTDEVYLKASKISKVKTIWQMSKEVDLNTFYHPTSIVAENSNITVTGLKSFPENCKVVIQGTAGQGKSILLRYIASEELKHGTVLPIFVELRKISEKNSLENLIIDGFKQLGLKVASDELDPILETGRCILLLDAFDELGSNKVQDTITSIESWCCKFHNLPIIVSSRPEGAIQSSAHFSVFNIKQLESPDFKPLLMKLFDSDKEKVQAILTSINGNSIQTLVSTPLLLTLLAIHYVEEGEVPQSLAGFYEKLFHIMCSRHDSSKPGYVREFYSKLNKDDLNNVFNVFCFECARKEYTSLSFEEAKNLAEKAIKQIGNSDESATLFLDDIVKVTCLLLKEGHQLHFIHRSIMEFHAAKCISKMPENVKAKFYHHALDTFPKYKQELEFLSSLDNLMYIEFYKIPLFEKILNELNGSYGLSELLLTIENKRIVGTQHPNTGVPALLSTYFHDEFMNYHTELFVTNLQGTISSDNADAEELLDISVNDLLRIGCEHSLPFELPFSNLRSSINSLFNETKIYIENEKNKFNEIEFF